MEAAIVSTTINGFTKVCCKASPVTLTCLHLRPGLWIFFVFRLAASFRRKCKKFASVFYEALLPAFCVRGIVMRKVVLEACCAVCFALVGVAPTLAFGGHCGDRAVECYDKVQTPDLYATRTRSVLVRPVYRSVVPTPPVVRNVTVPIVVRPGRWRTVVAPPVYSARRERVLVSPGHKVFEEIPAVTRRVEKTVVVPGEVRWRRTRDAFGHERLCKVVSRARTRTIVREVVVAPARRVAHVSRPVYDVVERPVEVRPALARRVYEPAVHGYINRSVIVRPASVAVVSHPPVVGVTREHVLVRPGGYAWVRSRP
jgi:hypothetical protein